MAIQIFTDTGNQVAQFSHPNSGYTPTTAGPTANTFSFSSTSGNCLLKQYSLLSGQSQLIDFCSGGLLDLVGDSLNSNRVYNVQFLGSSGTVQMELYQSGAMRIPALSTQSGFPQSGFGYMVTPGDSLKVGIISGNALQAGQQNVNFRAVSGAALFQVGIYGTN